MRRHDIKHPIRAFLICGLILSGCVGTTGVGSVSSKSVLQGGFTVAAPTGYCLDAKASRETDNSGIFLIGRCFAQSPTAPALVSVAVGAPASAGVMTAGGAELAAFFTSVEGRATLSAKGQPGSVRVLEALSVGDVFVMRLQERGDPEYWRAVMGLRGRLVSVSVKDAGDGTLSQETGRTVLDRAIAALQRANRV